MESLTAIDLFAGAGGATCGLNDAGFRILAGVESDAVAAESYLKNHPEAKVVVSPIEQVDAGKLREELELERGELSLMNACPPCQGYSTLGKCDPQDPRNDLVSEVWRFIQVFRPQTFVLENVPGLARDERLLKLIRRARGGGYTVRHYVVDAVDFGVPQRRRRLIVLGTRVHRGKLRDSLTSMLPLSFKTTAPTAGEVLASSAHINSSDRLHRARKSSPAVMARIRSIPLGGGRFDLAEEHRLRCHSALGGRQATSSYGRIRADEPAPTMTTRCTTPACGRFVHPTEHRGLTLREAALLQTFPPDYSFAGGHDEVERQIGNAVPVRLAEAVGCAVAFVLAP